MSLAGPSDDTRAAGARIVDWRRELAAWFLRSREAMVMLDERVPAHMPVGILGEGVDYSPGEDSNVLLIT